MKQLFCFYLMTGVLLNAQTPFCIPYGNASVIDGHITAGEWSDADSVEIIINASQKVMVKYKHDNANFYFVFLKNLESAMRMPEVVMDINNSKSATWQSDDWWFHVSGTDCESNGSPNNYSNCQPVQPGWEGVPNMSSGPPYTDTVEIRISFTKVGLTLPTHSVIGLAFDVTNTFSAWNFWPSGANINSPATWATAILCAPSWLHEIS
jgi:hypothetical protein